MLLMEKVLEHDAEVRYFTYNNEMVGARAAPQATDVRESSTFGVCVKLHKVWSPDTSYRTITCTLVLQPI